MALSLKSRFGLRIADARAVRVRCSTGWRQRYLQLMGRVCTRPVAADDEGRHSGSPALPSSERRRARDDLLFHPGLLRGADAAERAPPQAIVRIPTAFAFFSFLSSADCTAAIC